MIINKKQLLDSVLAILYQAKEDKTKLQMIYDFFIEEIYDDDAGKIEIPEKYKKLVNSTAQSIDARLVCYLNTEKLELVEIFNAYMDHLMDDEENLLEQDFEKVDSWENKLVIEPLESFESFKIMECFVNEVPDEKFRFRHKLITALERRKPFANFKNLIDYSEYRQNWFDFKQKYLEEYVYGLFLSSGFVKN